MSRPEQPERNRSHRPEWTRVFLWWVYAADDSKRLAPANAYLHRHPIVLGFLLLAVVLGGGVLVLVGVLAGST